MDTRETMTEESWNGDSNPTYRHNIVLQILQTTLIPEPWEMPVQK
jgi:hypothetical protein